MSYYDATARCRSFAGGDLVSIFSKKENEFIAKKVLEANLDLEGTETFNYPWIGLKMRKSNHREGKETVYINYISIFLKLL